MSVKSRNGNNVRQLVMLAMFTALAYAAMLFIHIKVGFLTMDVKDAIITLCGLYFGPVAALVISVLVPLLELATISDTGFYGLIMNILGSVAFSVTASVIYKWKKTLLGAVIGLLTGAFFMTAVMLGFNLLVTPFYMGVTMADVRGMIPTLLFPFNLLKGVINVGAVLLLYKPLSKALRKAGVFPRGSATSRDTAGASCGENSTRPGTKSSFLISFTVAVDAIALIALSLVLIFSILGGSFDFGF